MNEIKVFESKEIRSVLHDGEWYFAIVDIVAVLSESANPSDYLKKMRKRDKELAKGWGQIVTPLTIDTVGGKQKLNCANKEGIFRIVQSIPSPKAEPFKLWLARVGAQVVDEKASKRLEARKKLGETQQRFFENIKDRGVDEDGFKRVVGKGDESLFGGEDLKQKNAIPPERELDDFLPSISLKAKDFATELSNYQVSLKDLLGEEEITGEHIKQNQDLRQYLIEKGIKPEDLPPEEDLKKLEAKIKKLKGGE